MLQDSEIRVKACQCIILLCSMDDDVIAQCVVDNFKLNHFLIGRLTTLFYEIPPNDCTSFKNIEASWTYVKICHFIFSNRKLLIDGKISA